MLTLDELVYAYVRGWFLLSDEDGSHGWYSVPERALFPISGVRVSRSLDRTIRSGRFEVRFDTDFAGVVSGCRRPEGTWITDEIMSVSLEAHRQGWAHSAECWTESGLAGGVYGYALGGCFFAESMFHRHRDASKVALWAMVAECRRLGFTVFDAQIMNPHLASLGAFSVPELEFKRLLAEALSRSTPWSLQVRPLPETR